MNDNITNISTAQPAAREPPTVRQHKHKQVRKEIKITRGQEREERRAELVSPV